MIVAARAGRFPARAVLCPEGAANVMAGDGLVIEPFGEGDLDAAREVYNHYVVHSTATFAERPLDPAAAREMFQFADPRHAAFALRHGGEFVGYSLVGPYKTRCAYREAAEVAVYLGPGRTGRGWGRQALSPLERHGRRHGLHVLIAGVCTENVASMKLFPRAGYEPVAHFREVGFKFGRRLDVAYFQKLLA